MRLSRELEAVREEISAYAESFGLDFFPTVFEIVTLEQMSEVASYGGFPTRYPHWRFGMEFEELDRGTTYGLQRIYELVLNTNPCYAYLLRCNSMVDQKMVIAHVLGHSDFFKNNEWFAHTNRKMLDEMANHAVRVRRYMDRYGQDLVEDFIDACLSLENLIDVHACFRPHRRSCSVESSDIDDDGDGVHRLRSKEYMDPYINPEEFLEEQRRRIEEARARSGMLPSHPEKDVLGFLSDYAPLDSWERDILAIVREEALYFAPQRQTKIMNEGWATYWHSRIMTEKALGDSEVVDYAERHAGTVGTHPGSINPYKLGVEIFRDIEDRWNRGAYGKDYEECDSMKERANWDRSTGEGMAKLFEVRRVHNDVTFIETFLTEDFCQRRRMFTYAYDEEGKVYRISSRQFAAIRERFLFSLTNMGQPIILVEDANHHNRGELLLRHMHGGFDLRLDYARDTLARLHRLWHRPVNLITVIGKKEKIISYNGSDWEETETGDTPGEAAQDAA